MRPQHRERAAAPRRARRFGGFVAAACLALSLGVVGLWHQHVGAPHPAEATAASSAAATPDRIFASSDRIFASNEAPHRAKASHDGDRLFRGDFAGG